MRKSFLTAVVLTMLLAVSVLAESYPHIMQYQGSLINSSGEPVPDGNYAISFRIFDDLTGGNELWSEAYPAVTSSGGQIAVALGSINAISLDSLTRMAAYSGASLYLDIQIGSDAPISPRTRLGGSLFSAVAMRLHGDVETGPGLVTMLDSLGDTVITWNARAAKGTIRYKPPNPGASTQQTGIGAGDLTLTSIGPSGDTSEIILIVDTAEAKLSITKADAKKSLEAFVSNISIGLSIVDSTLDDSALIDLRIDSSGNSGIDIKTAKKKVKFRAGVDLAKKVLKASDDDREGAYMGLGGNLDHFVGIDVDSVTSSLVFADTLGDTTFLVESDAAHVTLKVKLGPIVSFETTADTSGGEISLIDAVRMEDVSITSQRMVWTDHETGREDASIGPDGLSISKPGGGGLPDSDVQIADLDADGDLDMSVDGNVGIGVSIPTNILEVVQGSSTDPIADAWGVYSSRRWKKNIKPIEGALGKVEKLRGVTYDWKADGKHDIGLIAEEVGEVFPEIVAYEENGIDAKSVDYARLVAVLIEAVKELKAENDQLKSDLAQSETTSNDRMNKLQAQVTQLSALLEQLLTFQNNSIPPGGESIACNQQNPTAFGLSRDQGINQVEAPAKNEQLEEMTARLSADEGLTKK